MRLLLLISVIIMGFVLPKEKWNNLFNGKNLNGWDTWLAAPDSSYDVPGMTRSANGKYNQPIGLNHDPLNVFTVSTIDGQPAIHISGQGFGAITTHEEFENFHLTLEYKWGEKKWAPRDKSKRDSGILYYCVGEHGAGSGAWMKSQECQVQENDTGDYWSVAGAIADVNAETVSIDGIAYRKYAPNAASVTIGKVFDGKDWNQLRCLKRELAEKKHSEWNRVDVYCYNGKSVHVVNGKTVMVINNSRQIVNNKEVPLTKGKIQIQTEGAEVYYRDIKIQSINEIPATVLN